MSDERPVVSDTTPLITLAGVGLLVLLDERRGRRLAQQRGLVIAGTGAILLAAKSAGLVPAIAPPLRRMIEQGRYLSPRLLVTLLEAANEVIDDIPDADLPH